MPRGISAARNATMLALAAGLIAAPGRAQSRAAAASRAQSPASAGATLSISGFVRFNRQPVPGATVTASRGTQRIAVTTGGDGSYILSTLTPGLWILRVSMTGFAPSERPLMVAAGAPSADWELRLLPYRGPPIAATEAESRAAAASSTGSTAARPAAGPPAALESNPNLTAAPSLAINGSVNNGAAAPYFQPPAFGNNRRGQNYLYNGSVGGIFDVSQLDASPFSLTGQTAAKPPYAHATGLLNLGGPLIIPGIFSADNAPMIFVAYQIVRDRVDSIASGQVPTMAERQGNLSQLPQPILNPATGQPFPGNMIPTISPQAAALLALYPAPNAAAGPFNYQVPLVTITHEDNLQTRVMKRLNQPNQISGQFALSSTREGAPNLFGFLDTTDTLGLNTQISWRHAFTARFEGQASIQYSRLRVRTDPFFANRENVSGLAGITGDDQAPADWGPPSLTFSGGIAALSDATPADNRNQTSAFSYSGFWNHGDHNWNFGGDFRRLEFNNLEQQDPRGQFTFNGAATGDDFADFLLGIPDTAAIAFGNADKYFREPSLDLYATDDWRLAANWTLNAGLRWEYTGAPTELYGRLVNLDIAPGFTAAAPVLASDPLGPLTGTDYPSSLVRPDRGAIEPRIGIAWQPFPASSMVVRAGYGIYYNTSVYQTIAAQLAQQAPLSISRSLANSPAEPLTLANAFMQSSPATPDLFAIDPNFRLGYVQTWNASVQQDLPGSFVMTLSYTGNHGSHAAQEYLPNTYPPGAANPCPTCPVGFTYLTSGGDSSYEAGTAEIRRRFAGGIAADLQYTYESAIDDGALGGRNQATPLIAQNWLDLDAERAPSSFEQRNQLNASAQYTTGIGVHGGALLRGWEAAVYNGWTLQAQLTAASGMPLTPVTFAVVPGTGVTESIRPSLTGASIYAAPPGLFLNPAAYAAPPSGSWGNAGRDSITGPGQFTLNLALQRSFPVGDRVQGNFRVEADNALNHVVFPTWDTVVGSAQFGLPPSADAMRTLQLFVRFNF